MTRTGRAETGYNGVVSRCLHRLARRTRVDRKNGEWFIGVSREGKVGSPVKISFWKCPYHNGRACMELIDRLRATYG